MLSDNFSIKPSSYNHVVLPEDGAIERRMKDMMFVTMTNDCGA